MLPWMPLEFLSRDRNIEFSFDVSALNRLVSRYDKGISGIARSGKWETESAADHPLKIACLSYFRHEEPRQNHLGRTDRR